MTHLTDHPNLKDFLQVSQVDTAKQYPAFLDHLFAKIDSHMAHDGKVLLLTLTKKSSEEISNFMISKWYKTFYLHSEIATIDRREIIKKLRSGQIDILVWINLLREGIDIPEVSLIAILDADKEWFLRSTTSLVQIIWRAARNPLWEVVLYADNFTESMVKSLRETYRRRITQQEYNVKNNITPSVALSNIKKLEVVKTDEILTQNSSLLIWRKVKKLKRATKAERELIMKDLKIQMDLAIKERRFEDAARLRDDIKEISGENDGIENDE